MGFQLDAFVGRAAELQRWKVQLPSTVVCPLSGELGLVPLTSRFSGELRTWVGEPKVSYPEYVLRWGKEASGDMIVAFVSVGEFGNQSHEEVTIWTQGREVMTGVRLMPALDYLREKAGMDLGDRDIESLLEQHRGEDAAEKWAAKS